MVRILDPVLYRISDLLQIGFPQNFALLLLLTMFIIPYLLTLLGLISYAERQYFHT